MYHDPSTASSRRGSGYRSSISVNGKVVFNKFPVEKNDDKTTNKQHMSSIGKQISPEQDIGRNVRWTQNPGQHISLSQNFEPHSYNTPRYTRGRGRGRGRGFSYAGRTHNSIDYKKDLHITDKSITPNNKKSIDSYKSVSYKLAKIAEKKAIKLLKAYEEIDRKTLLQSRHLILEKQKEIVNCLNNCKKYQNTFSDFKSRNGYTIQTLLEILDPFKNKFQKKDTYKDDSNNKSNYDNLNVHEKKKEIVYLINDFNSYARDLTMKADKREPRVIIMLLEEICGIESMIHRLKLQCMECKHPNCLVSKENGFDYYYICFGFDEKTYAYDCPYFHKHKHLIEIKKKISADNKRNELHKIDSKNLEKYADVAENLYNKLLQHYSPKISDIITDYYIKPKPLIRPCHPGSSSIVEYPVVQCKTHVGNIKLVVEPTMIHEQIHILCQYCKTKINIQDVSKFILFENNNFFHNIYFNDNGINTMGRFTAFVAGIHNYCSKKVNIKEFKERYQYVCESTRSVPSTSVCIGTSKCCNYRHIDEKKQCINPNKPKSDIFLKYYNQWNTKYQMNGLQRIAFMCVTCDNLVDDIGKYCKRCAINLVKGVICPNENTCEIFKCNGYIKQFMICTEPLMGIKTSVEIEDCPYFHTPDEIFLAEQSTRFKDEKLVLEKDRRENYSVFTDNILDRIRQIQSLSDKFGFPLRLLFEIIDYIVTPINLSLNMDNLLPPKNTLCIKEPSRYGSEEQTLYLGSIVNYGYPAVKCPLHKNSIIVDTRKVGPQCIYCRSLTCYYPLDNRSHDKHIYKHEGFIFDKKCEIVLIGFGKSLELSVMREEDSTSHGQISSFILSIHHNCYKRCIPFFKLHEKKGFTSMSIHYDAVCYGITPTAPHIRADIHYDNYARKNNFIEVSLTGINSWLVNDLYSCKCYNAFYKDYNNITKCHICLEEKNNNDNNDNKDDHK